MYRYSQQSKQHLGECHPKLQTLARIGLIRSYQKGLYDFGISDGGRFLWEQKVNMQTGASRTLRSRHRFAWPLDKRGYRIGKFKTPVSHAFDHFIVINGKARWEEALYKTLWKEVWLPTAKELDIEIGGGYFWGWDYGHIQLSWKHYPARYADDEQISRFHLKAA